MFKPLTPEQIKELALKASHAHSQTPAILSTKSKMDPRLIPTWEAGRACGFNAASLPLSKEIERLKVEVEELMEVDYWQERHDIIKKDLEALTRKYALVLNELEAIQKQQPQGK